MKILAGTTRALKIWLAALLLGLVACQPVAELGEACSADTPCAEDLVCRDGVCADPELPISANDAGSVDAGVTDAATVDHDEVDAAGADAGTEADAANPADAATDLDATTPADVATPADAAAADDVASPADAAIPADAATPVDAADPADSAAPADSTIPVDSAVPSDAAVDDATVDDATVDDAAVDDATVDDATVDDATVDDATVDDATVDDATVDDAAVDDATVDDAAVDPDAAPWIPPMVCPPNESNWSTGGCKSYLGSNLVTTSFRSSSDDADLSCNPGAYLEDIYCWTAPSAGTFRFDLTGRATGAAIAVFSGDTRCEELACDNPGSGATVDVSLGNGETVHVVVERTATASGGSYMLAINPI